MQGREQPQHLWMQLSVLAESPLNLPGRQITTVVPKELTNGCRKNSPSRYDAKVRLSETRCQEVLGVCVISETNS